MSEIWRRAFCAVDRQTKRRQIYRIRYARLEAPCPSRGDGDAFLNEGTLSGADVSRMSIKEALALGAIELIGEVTGFAIANNFDTVGPPGRAGGHQCPDAGRRPRPPKKNAIAPI